MSSHALPSPSFLDQLIAVSRGQVDPLPMSAETTSQHARLIEGLRHDIETLLNARQTRLGMDDYPALQRSILGYGLPDTQGFDLETPESRYRLVRTLESVIETFETRVAEAYIELQEDALVAHHLRMAIRLRLHQPFGIELGFQSELKLATGRFSLKSLDQRVLR